MALALTLNGSPTNSIPGSPATGDRIAMNNGVIRLSFVWKVHASSPARWWRDLVEYSPDGGSTWQTVFMSRDGHRCNVNGGGGDISTTNAALSLITNTASQITLQMQASNTVASGTNAGVTITMTTQYTMTTSVQTLEVTQWVAAGAALTLTANQFFEEWGDGYLTVGLGTATKAVYDGVKSTFNNNRVDPLLFSGNRVAGRYFARPANTNARSFHGGVCLYLTSGILATAFMKPAAYQFLTTQIQSSGTPIGGPEWQVSPMGYTSFIKNVSGDTAFASVTDNNSAFLRPGSRGGSASSSTFPQATSATATDGTALTFTWSLALEVPTTGGYTGVGVPLYLFPQSINKWVDTIYPRPTIATPWQSLAAWESNVLPTVVSTLNGSSTPFFDSNYGYAEHIADTTVCTNFSNALALQACLRWNNLGVGNADALTFADKLAVVIANYSQQGTAQAGAIQKIRNLGPNTFTCQDTTHQANADQPHVSSYVMAEAILALIEYYKVRGNQTLAATYGNTTVAAVLDAAMAYLVSVQTSDGGWLVEYNNVNTATSTNGRIGRNFPGSSTIDFAASLISWANSSPTASTSTKAQWQQVANRAILYVMTSEASAHGCYEYGEDYINYSSHASKMFARGFYRLYEMTGNPLFQEWMAYYAEIGIFLCKRVDEIENKPINGGDNGTNGQDVHTGGMMSTIDFSGIESGEITNYWALLLTDILRVHPNPLAYWYFYCWASLMHMTWAYRDLTYLAGSAFSYAYCSPGTSASGFASGIDNTRFTYFATGAALHLLPVQTLIQNSNTLVLATCLEANKATSNPSRRTVILYNPQGTTQTTNLTIKGQAGKTAKQDGSPLTPGTSGSDMTLTGVSVAAGSVSTILIGA